MEKLGIPTVTITTDKFLFTSKTLAMTDGLPSLSLVAVQHPLELLTQAEVESKAEGAFDEIMKAATDPKTGVTPLRKATAAPQKVYPAETIRFKGSIEDINDHFFEKGWATGIPIIPPTKASVARMLAGTRRSPDEVLWEIPPRGGNLTVELVAIHAVMAGARPEYMPVLIAVIEAMREDALDWRSAVTTTPKWPVIVLNGPIIKELGIACDTGTGGPGFRPNNAIGFTIGLITNIVGGLKYPTPNMAPVGMGAEFVPAVMGENEEAIPEGWDPLHVEMGFQRTDSVVSVKVCRGFNLLGENGQSLVDMLSGYAKTLGWCRTPFDASEMFLILPPLAAGLFAREGWTKGAIREFLWENARVPIKSWKRKYPKDALVATLQYKDFCEKYGPITPDTPVPPVDSPEKWKLLVTGGSSPHAFYYQGAQGRMVSKLITK
jgi:hypothetical protein